MIQIIPPHGFLKVTVDLPLSKSIANRQLCIRFLSGSSDEYNLPDCDDSLRMHELLDHLHPDNNQEVFDCGDAGTVFRFLTAILANIKGDRLITGSERMYKRPCAPLVDALNLLGADVRYQLQTGFPPLFIKGKPLHGGEVFIDASVSSQFISALMMTGAVMTDGLKIVLKGKIVSRPYIELTVWLMQQQGIEVEFFEHEIRILPGRYQFNQSLYEADWSAASYWYALAALSHSAEIRLRGLNKNSFQGDQKLTLLFEGLGVRSRWDGENLLLSGHGIIPGEFSADFTDCPDLFPAVAVTCAGLGLKSRFTGLSTLAVKESDRLKSVGNELTRLGYQIVHTGEDTFEIMPGRVEAHDNRIETYTDHRIAMAFAALSVAAGQLFVLNPSVVSKSYPGFWNDLQKAGFNLEYC
ncbi:MAG: 3-phosphoshikimate 1-carboxyvinyltransferase [Lentimicrobium sp.]